MELVRAVVRDEGVELGTACRPFRPGIEYFHAESDRQPEQAHQPPVARSSLPYATAQAAPIAATGVLQTEQRE